MAPLRWGIIGAGKISEDFVTALRTIRSDTQEALHTVVAVASSNLQRSQEFCKRQQISAENALDSYEKLVSLENVQAVYIGTIHTMHLDHGEPDTCTSEEVFDCSTSTAIIIVE